jgi:hypothetical protein
MLSRIFYGAMYGGSITSIPVNIPGEAASVVTNLDGYQMARQGKAGLALDISTFGSVKKNSLTSGIAIRILRNGKSKAPSVDVRKKTECEGLRPCGQAKEGIASSDKIMNEGVAP